MTVTIVADVSKPEEVAAALRKAAGHFAEIDVLFLNAGVSEAPRILALTEQEFDALIGTNPKGVVFAVRYALPLLSHGASIILTGSSRCTKGAAGRPALRREQALGGRSAAPLRWMTRFSNGVSAST